VATLDCNMEIWVTNQTLKDYQCTQHVKLWFPFAMKGLQSVVLMGKCTAVFAFSDLASEKFGMNIQLYCGGNSQAAVY
jgi:hypothetical protein